MVDEDDLCQMVMPCLVQMLDAFYSGLVMSELYRHGNRIFVGIHDCWFVPRDALPALERAMEVASKKWYMGLEPVYEDLLKYLAESSYADLIESAWSRWKERVTDGSRLPSFKAKRDAAT
jgi:hypothetical protein